MTKLPGPVQDEFMKGNHVMRHQPGIWNGLWSDLFIESTFMRYGHSPGGIVGITLQPSTLKRWALGLHICAQLKKDVMSLADNDVQTTVTSHKEEGKSRILNDVTDREKIRNKLVTCIDPLNPGSHPSASLINIVTGRISPASVTVDDSVQLGRQLMKTYEEGWPQSFYKPLKKSTVTMSVTRKQVNVGDVGVFDTSLIYSRVMCLQKVRDIDMKDVLGYELAAVPPSMFDETSEMHITKSKSTLKTNLQVELTDRRSIPPDVLVLDGCAILWVVNWPAHGLVQDFIRNVVDYVSSHLRIADTYLIFDRYYDNSIKETTRTSRAGNNASRQHQLSNLTPLPPQKFCLTVTQNKLQLINLICMFLRERHDLLPQNRNLLVVTGAEPTPMEICDGSIRERPDLRTTHEEADVIIIQQVVHLANSGKLSIRVIADDTDVYVLLLHYYKMKQLTCNLVMIGTSSARKCADIKATAEKHANIIGSLLPAHVLSGCDTVSSLWGIGKGTVLKVLKSGKKSLNKLGETQEHFDEIMFESTAFIASCYGFQYESDMTSLRYKVWTNKMANHKLNSAPKLRVLPPTKEAFDEHVSRAHLQAAIWRCALDADPPDLNPVHYGWSMNADTKKLEPIALPADVSPAPVSVLKMIKCGCSSSQPCSSARCSCSTARISCSVFCTCHGDNDCKNAHTITAVRGEEYDEGDDSDSGAPELDILDAMDND